MIATPRLTLVPATIELLRADLRDREELARLLGAVVPPTWPPDFYDEPAVTWVLDRLESDPGSEWFFHYFVRRESPTVIGAGGYKGPPANGTVEVGYSVLPEHRRQGYASEATCALVERAFSDSSVARIVAHTFPNLVGSIGVLEKCGFALAGDGEEAGTIRYELQAARQS